jgi:hypothetical protein
MPLYLPESGAEAGPGFLWRMFHFNVFFEGACP